MSEPKHSGILTTNTTPGSIARASHAEPEIYIIGRVAGKFPGVSFGVGTVGYASRQHRPDLHFILVINDPYSGILGIDGQPTNESGNKGLIRSGFYRGELPPGEVIRIKSDLLMPPGINKILIAQKLIINAQNFGSYTIKYSLPHLIIGDTMVEGHYNSSSYVAGLLNSVLGYVPSIGAYAYYGGYQIPGWETPIPASYFKGEALK